MSGMGKNSHKPSVLSSLSTASDTGDSYSTRPDEYQTGRTRFIVITGSVIKTRYPEPGDRMRYDIDGRADVVLTIN